MKERPILFSGPMVRAILDGRKKMTRRVVKYPPFDSCDEGILSEWAIGNIACPYGQKGDRLWVRETWKPINHAQRTDETYVRYAADEGLLAIKHEMKMDVPTKWRPSIFMPRWASRIRLEVTDVRVERLNDISEEDAIAEGFDLKLCEDVLYAAAGEVEPDEAYWVTDADHEDLGEGYLCHDCAKALQEKNPGSHISYCCCPESDGPAMCEVCYRPLYLSLTEYGIERELFLECPIDEDRKNFAASGSDACIAAMIAGGHGDLKEEHHGRLAQIGFATLWDSIYEKQGHAWSKNEWVWVVSFVKR